MDSKYIITKIATLVILVMVSDMDMGCIYGVNKLGTGLGNGTKAK